jgi:hypothetical protein
MPIRFTNGLYRRGPGRSHVGTSTYLIGRDGYIAEVFPETVEPSDTRIKTAIARALAQP